MSVGGPRLNIDDWTLLRVLLPKSEDIQGENYSSMTFLLADRYDLTSVATAFSLHYSHSQNTGHCIRDRVSAA